MLKERRRKEGRGEEKGPSFRIKNKEKKIKVVSLQYLDKIVKIYFYNNKNKILV